MNDASGVLSVVYSKGPIDTLLDSSSFAVGALPDSGRLAVWTSDNRYSDIVYSEGVCGN